MPVSSSVQVSDCIEHILTFEPASVLDIGCGFGLWGFLCREYLDVWNGRVQPEEWTVRIEGVELWEPYIQKHQRALYDQIHIGDVREIVPTLGEYDLIIAGDVIEHLEKPDALKVVEQLYARAKKALLVNIPLTGDWDHPEQYGNPGELHRSVWTVADFAHYRSVFNEYKLPCGEYGSFCFVKDEILESYIEAALKGAEARSGRGDIRGALRAVGDARSLMPEDPGIALAAADLHLQAGDVEAAIAVLRATLALTPDFHVGRFTLVRLLRMHGQAGAADRELQELLAATDLPRDLRTQAEALATQSGA